jgi:prevent-host-death family protein
MCYGRGVNERVGVRELRQNLSRHLRRVQAGERLVVTEHGRPVALLTPWAETGDPLERMIADGRARRGAGRLLDIEPFPRRPSRDASDTLAEERRERL